MHVKDIKEDKIPIQKKKKNPNKQINMRVYRNISLTFLIKSSQVKGELTKMKDSEKVPQLTVS